MPLGWGEDPALLHAPVCSSLLNSFTLFSCRRTPTPREALDLMPLVVFFFESSSHYIGARLDSWDPGRARVPPPHPPRCLLLSHPIPSRPIPPLQRLASLLPWSPCSSPSSPRDATHCSWALALPALLLKPSTQRRGWYPFQYLRKCSSSTHRIVRPALAMWRRCMSIQAPGRQLGA